MSHQDKSMLITFSGACLLVLVFFFLGVKPYEDPNPEEEFIAIPVIQEPLEEEEVKEEVTQQQMQVKSHQVYNASELRNESRELFKEEDLIRKAIEQQQLESVEDLEAENEKTLEEHKKSTELAMAERKERIKAQIEEREKERASKKGNRESTVSYNLKGRNALRIPNPVYTCDAIGSIVLDIEVSNTGTITKKEYNKKASTSSNGCLIDQALIYASEAYFDSSSNASQKGTITFYFQG
ncbi:hypothetical protein [Dokdonia sp.]|uniref:hypothetical protein n=1 Tax=Dokdonia sp. TaxID=2024995 RepID=UPI00326535C7